MKIQVTAYGEFSPYINMAKYKGKLCSVETIEFSRIISIDIEPHVDENPPDETEKYICENLTAETMIGWGFAWPNQELFGTIVVIDDNDEWYDIVNDKSVIKFWLYSQTNRKTGEEIHQLITKIAK